MRRFKIAAAAIILLLLGTGKALAACDGADTSGGNYCVYQGSIDSVIGGSLEGGNYKVADSSANLYYGIITLPAVCGNGIFDAGEQCDDNNTATGDGCSATCAIENGWNCSGSPSVCSLNQHLLTVNATGRGSGTVGGGGTYAYGTTHDITAIADNGSTFTGWSGDCSGTTRPNSVTMLDRDMTCTATFAIDTYTISFSFTGSGAMTCSPTTVSWGGGFGCIVSPGSGYHLERLLDNSVDVTSSVSGSVYTVGNVSANHTVQATFQQNSLVLRNSGNNRTWYSSIQSAYDAASSTDIILTQASSFHENLNFDRNISITVRGGYNSDFNSVTGFTLINGMMTISSGTVIVENLILTTDPAVIQVIPVLTLTTNHNPSYTFSSSVAGTITYGGSCSSATTAAVFGNNTITLTATGGGPLSDGTYSDCTIIVTDVAGNASAPLTINTFTISNNIFAISFSVSGSGAMTCTPTTVQLGESFTCTLYPDGGYYLESLIDNTSDVTSLVSNDLYSVGNVTADHTIDATFQQNPVVLRLWGNTEPYFFAGYSSIMEAYLAASNKDDILIQALQFDGDLTFDRDIFIMITGGYNTDFESFTGFTTIHGTMTISNGTVIIENLILK